MAYEIDLRKHFTKDVIVQTLQTLPEIKSPIMDLIFSTRTQHPFATIGLSEVTEITRNVPLVKRGSPSFNVANGTMEINYIEPQGFSVNEIITAKELNDIKQLSSVGIQAWQTQKIDRLRRIIRTSTETLCSLALKGFIEYPVKIEGGIDKYSVNYGAVQELLLSLYWDDNTANLETIVETLIEIQTLLQEKSGGYGATIKFLAGKEAFFKLANKITNLQNDSRIVGRVDNNVINIAGFEVFLTSYQYYDIFTETMKNVVEPKYLCAIATDAPHTLYYLALDDIDANLLPMPFYIKTLKTDDPSGFKLIGMSKPLPIVVPKAILWSKVISG